MLQIQRASAGSGKTYTLAKKFILHLIGRRNKKNLWQLRSDREIEETLSRILAITFTNKATNEMKQRIVSKLAALSSAASMPLTSEILKKTDYLEDFQKLFGEDYKKIGEKCRCALKIILNNYSGFHISTIDSFFQEILRTFAYEVNLNDAYELEIDSDFISASALDSTLNDFERKGDPNRNVKFWMKIIMNQEAKKSQNWNVFAKSERSVYSQIKKALKELDSEEYKIYKDDLLSFFDAEDSSEKVQRLYLQLKNNASEERRGALNKILNLQRELVSEIEYGTVDESGFNRYFLPHLSKIEKMKPDEDVPFQFNGIIKDGSVFKKAFRTLSSLAFDEKAMKMYGLLSDWNDPLKFPNYTAWRIYGELLPYFGIILEVSKRQYEILAEENLIKLSDTSELLKKIIGDDDVPFIYERIGSYVENYLIDEFQDTSRMQWDVIKPLIGESEAQRHESLIIGDPKQSIYRFRNADHKLILTDVPDAFPDHLASGLTKEENTNHRSLRHIVEFNNFFFLVLSGIIGGLSREKGNSYAFADLYSNVVQYPKSRFNEGFVEINFFEKPSETETSAEVSSDDEENGAWDWYDNKMAKEIGRQITELIKRGYLQKEIGILVAKNSQGQKVIEALMRYNDKLTPEDTPIRFVSEESLLLSSSPAVELIVSIFEKIVAGGMSRPKEETQEEPENKKSINWNRIKSDFQIYALTHPEHDGAKCLLDFLKTGNNYDLLYRLVEESEIPTLTSMIENIAGNLMTPEMRDSQAIFIAALQDAVSENANLFGNDVASFLEWWNLKGKKMSVSSPEDTDAVQVMTIHKSKGLEFKCVLIPYASDNFLPRGKAREWRWVKPELPFQNNDIPPCLPVKTSSVLEGTWHQDIYRNYLDQVMTDLLNMYYVAFTRARNELYVYCKKPLKNENTVNLYLSQICGQPGAFLEKISGYENREWLIAASLFETDETNGKITVGTKCTKEFILEESNKKNKTAGDEGRIEEYQHEISGYYVRKKAPALKFRLTDVSDFED